MADLTMHVFLSLISVILPPCFAGNTVYGKLGDEVVLRPDAGLPTGPLTSILWKHGNDIAIEWDPNGVEAYRQFKHRTTLNNVSGELTITALTQNDSGIYTPEINSALKTPIHLAVILSVPEPTILTSCDAEKTVCTLTCAGDTTGAEPVNYTWMIGHSSKTYTSREIIIKKDTPNEDEFKCQLQNPVSKKSSLSTRNPFLTAEHQGGLKVNIGLTLAICLLTAIVVLVLIHKCKTGMWFFQKASMPWQADFWRKEERTRREANESNGTSTREKAQGEEAAPMTAQDRV
ncbi:carcinoembryonic antigen-related cell adhesion molecule 1-like isoform X2 [Syngnathus acus]|uniref:carcinoembryonic antigen-related cell adhesion molecule 1-like isoform X2 n=1 Tax=Syngnathus acus TaxID=161584 RepID=UPI001885E19B|nr:carcinoembryonic antigen-related cell adhesion molecule 1-like isoform X2 [Syngnathus acus]